MSPGRTLKLVIPSDLRAACVAAAVMFGTCIAARAQPDPAPAGRSESARPFASAKELLAACGADASHFQHFVDGRPVGETELEFVWQVLHAFGRFVPAEVHQWRESAVPANEMAEAPEAWQGRIIRLEGQLLDVTEETPLPEAAQRLELPRYFRCEVQLEGGGSAIVYSLSVPRMWMVKDAAVRGARTSFDGVLLKRESADPPRMVLAARRMEWHLDTPLGRLGMDYGLFERVRNNRELTASEHEAFYSLLSAVGRADASSLDAQAQSDLDRLKKLNRKYVIEVPLFNQPEFQTGRLVVLVGVARRVTRIAVDEPEVHERFGLDHYFEIEAFTEGSQQNPIVFCVRSLPQGMPVGADVAEPVRIAGFFMKKWAYDTPALESPDGDPVQERLAPLIIGKEPSWFPREPLTRGRAGWFGGAVFALLVAGFAWIAWRLHRGERDVRQTRLDRQRELASDERLDNLAREVQDRPDFSGLP
jgi:hypothetical protein